jgi:medium-chain acyl-[acyl-carrier-protein] hydrolase
MENYAKSTLQTSGRNLWIDETSRRKTMNRPIRLFCFPYVGGSSAVFKNWAGYSRELEICPIRLPGHEHRLDEAPFNRLRPLVETLADVLPWDKPFALFGHSMGALVSFELARELRRRNLPSPLHLFVSARKEPLSATPERQRHLLPAPEFIQELRALGGTPEAVLKESSLMELMLPVLRADFAAIETYKYQHEATLSCPITAFGAYEDKDVPLQELCGWRDQTHNEFRLQMFSGDHFYLLQKEAEVVQRIEGALNSLARLYSPGKPDEHAVLSSAPQTPSAGD